MVLGPYDIIEEGDYPTFEIVPGWKLDNDEPEANADDLNGTMGQQNVQCVTDIVGADGEGEERAKDTPSAPVDPDGTLDPAEEMDGDGAPTDTAQGDDEGDGPLSTLHRVGSSLLDADADYLTGLALALAVACGFLFVQELDLWYLSTAGLLAYVAYLRADPSDDTFDQ